MTEREERIPNYIDYPYDVFIKLRLEFLLICQDEIEAKVMRIIEKAIEDKRKNLYRILVNKTPKGEEVQLPEQIWVAISHTFFLDRLYGTVQSLNTLKAALKSLIDKKLILKSEGGNGPYDALEYTLNKPLIKEKLADLPLLDELNVMTMMKQPRKPRKSRKVVETEGQKLTPSNFDTLENEEEGQSLTPQSINNCPPRGSKIDTKEGQKLTPKPRDIDYYLDDTQREENAHVSDDNAPTPSLSESNSPSSLQETSIEESTPAPSDEQSSKQESAVSDSQSKDMPPAQDTKEEKPSSGKTTRTRTSRSKKDVPEELRERVDAFYDFLDTWRQGVKNDPDESFERTAAGNAAICKLLEKKKPPTRERFKKHLDEMWNEPKNERTGYWTRKRMGSVAFICGEYETRSLALGSTEQTPVTNTKQIVENVASIAGYTQKTIDLALSQQEAPAMRHLGPRRNRRGA